MVPPTRATGFDHVGGVFLSATVELGEFGVVRYDTPVRWEAGTEDIRDQYQVVLDADGACRLRAPSDATRRAHQLGMRVAHVFPTQPSSAKLVDQ